MENADLHKSSIVTVRLRKDVLQFPFLAQIRQAQVSHNPWVVLAACQCDSSWYSF